MLLAHSVEDIMSGCANGVRCLRYTSGGGHYQGRWLRGQHHGYGVKSNGRGLTYEGHWQYGQRHGYGTLRRQLDTGHVERVYVGQWLNDKRSGEGKQYYESGDVYYGGWLDNLRYGRGIQWYADGRIYVGEWQQDVMHGSGVLFSANGNRYVGEFKDGCKCGTGVYYHEHAGQNVQQRGIWSNDICKRSLLIASSSSKPTTNLNN